MTPSISISNQSSIFFSPLNNNLASNPNSSELSNAILSIIELIKNAVHQNKIEALKNKPFFHIIDLLQKEIDSDTIGNLSTEIKQLNDLYQLIINDFSKVFTNIVLIRKGLNAWIYKFKWLLSIINHCEYIKVSPEKKDPRYTFYSPKAEIIFRKPPLNLSNAEFFGLIIPLIQDYHLTYNSLYITIPGVNEDSFTYFSGTILHLNQKVASPQEFYTEVLCFFGEQKKMITQAILRNTLNYGDNVPFPESIHFHADDVHTWEDLKCIRGLINYNHSFNELYFSLKMLEQYYQGNPKSLVEYQNIVWRLGGIKELKFREQLPLVLFKKQMNELLTVYKKKNQLFQFESYIFSRKTLQHLINLNTKPFLPCYFNPYPEFKCEFLNSNHHYFIKADSFFEVFYYSLNLSNKEISFTKLIENHISASTEGNKYDNLCYKINCSSSVIHSVYRFLDTYKFKELSPNEFFDLSFLFARAQIECEELDKKIKKITFGVDEWKAKFIQWNVNFNPINNS